MRADAMRTLKIKTAPSKLGMNAPAATNTSEANKRSANSICAALHTFKGAAVKYFAQSIDSKSKLLHLKGVLFSPIFSTYLYSRRKVLKFLD